LTQHVGLEPLILARSLRSLEAEEEGNALCFRTVHCLKSTAQNRYPWPYGQGYL